MSDEKIEEENSFRPEKKERERSIRKKIRRVPKGHVVQKPAFLEEMWCWKPFHLRDREKLYYLSILRCEMIKTKLTNK